MKTKTVFMSILILLCITAIAFAGGKQEEPVQEAAAEEESAVEKIETLIEQLKSQGGVAPVVPVEIAGSSDALNEIKIALLGDGSMIGFLTSSLFLALFVVYLLMVVLFQSWSYPLVIILSVPLATVGGLLGLSLRKYRDFPQEKQRLAI